MNNGNIILRVEKLFAGYDNNMMALKNISFGLAEGECLGIIGQNGSGKSTLLKALTGLLPMKEGRIWYRGNVNEIRRPYILVKHGISYFIQGGIIIQSLTVQEHLELAIRQSVNKNEKKHLNTVFDEFPKLYLLRSHRAGLLSGGERQMLSLGLLLVQNTRLWLLDEPTAGLSPEMVEFTVHFLKRKNKQDNISMLLIEHNMEVVFDMTRHICIMKEGSISAKFDTQTFTAPAFLNDLYYI